MNGKGSTQRPTDMDAFREGWERTFGVRETKRWTPVRLTSQNEASDDVILACNRKPEDFPEGLYGRIVPPDFPFDKSITAIDQPNVECPVCGGEGWVCEDHPDRAWGEGDGCCGGAGMPCRCNLLVRVVPGAAT